MNTIGTIQLTKTTEFIFYIDKYMDHEFANIRKFVNTNKYTGPTKSGIKINKKVLRIICEKLKTISKDISNIEEAEIAKIPVYKGKYIHVKIPFYKGFYSIDLREYYETEKYTGPSKKGVRIPFNFLDEALLYIENMLNIMENKKIHTTNEADKIEEKKVTIDQNNKIIEGVPNEYNKYFE